MINSIRVRNFKSFENIEVSLDKFNVLIGANASGKSNFVSLFRFLKDCLDSGLNNAISMQGGVDYLRNASICAKNLVVDILFKTQARTDYTVSMTLEGKRTFGELDINKLRYMFKIEFPKSENGYRVGEEKLESSFTLRHTEKKRGNRAKRWKEVGKGELVIWRHGKDEIECTMKPDTLPTAMEDIFPIQRIEKSASPKKVSKMRGSDKELLIVRGGQSLASLLENSLFSPFTGAVAAYINNISTYDIDPKLSKRSTAVTGKTVLESDGNNLAIVLQEILSNEKNKEKLLNILRDALPFVNTLWVERLSDKSVLTCLKESYCGKKLMPAPFISDGTMSLLALIVALHFTQNSLLVIEEPERSIHPRLISRVISMMKDASERMNKQVIVTTHNPEVVKYAGIDSILLAYRDKNGFSQVSRPAEKSEVKEFLTNNMGVEELFVQNMLQW
jgi:predicted ATPase